MKILRTIIIPTLFWGCMVFTGCEGSNTSNNQQEQTVPQSEVKSMDSKEKKQVMDSISALTSQIEILSTRQESNTENLNKVSKEVSDLKGASHLFDLISWVMAAIALLAAIIALIKLNSIKKRTNKFKDLEYRISSLEQKTVPSPVRARTGHSEISSSDYASLVSRINYIERQIDKLGQNSTQVHQNAVPTIPALTPEIHQSNSDRLGYFGLPSQISLTEAYFKRLSDTRDSDSLFKVTVRDTKAEFRPIEGTQYLNEIKSNDDIKMALNIQGCAPSEATQMKVILPGEAQKDGNRWKITKKATIALYR